MAKTKLNAPQTSEQSRQKEEKAQKNTFFTVLCYCLLIIFLPIVGFFGSKYLLFDTLLQLGSTQSNIYSAVVAVVALHLALFLYIYKAYFETESRDSGAKQQKATKKD